MVNPTLKRNRQPRPRHRRWVAIALLAVTTAPAMGQAFRWLGPDGSLHLSDQPPPSNAQPWHRVEVPRYRQPSLSPKQDPYSITNQLRRMEEKRVALQEKRWRERLEEMEQRLDRRERVSDEAEPPATAPVHIYPPTVRHQRPRLRGRWHYDDPPFSGQDHPSYRVPRQRPPLPRSRAIDRATR